VSRLSTSNSRLLCEHLVAANRSTAEERPQPVKVEKEAAGKTAASAVKRGESTRPLGKPKKQDDKQEQHHSRAVPSRAERSLIGQRRRRVDKAQVEARCDRPRMKDLRRTNNHEEPQQTSVFAGLTVPVVLPDGHGGFAPCPELLTEEEAIRYLRLDGINVENPASTLRYYRKRGLLRATQVGKCIRYRRIELERLLERLTQDNPR